MPVAKKWKGPGLVDHLVEILDHRLYECQKRHGKHSTQLKGQIKEVEKVLTPQEKLLRMRLQGSGAIV